MLSPPLKIKNFVDTSKKLLKIEITTFPYSTFPYSYSLLHMQTRVCLKYLVNDCSTNFILLLESRDTIGRLMKTYLHRPVKFLYFLPSRDFKNVSHNFKIFLHFQQYATWKLSCVYNKGFSYMLFCCLKWS